MGTEGDLVARHAGEASARGRTMDSRTAADYVINALKHPSMGYNELRAACPNRVFPYANDGWGVLFPSGRLVFSESEYGEGVHVLRERTKIVNGWLRKPQWDFSVPPGTIPQELIQGAVRYANILKARQKALTRNI